MNNRNPTPLLAVLRATVAVAGLSAAAQADCEPYSATSPEQCGTDPATGEYRCSADCSLEEQISRENELPPADDPAAEPQWDPYWDPTCFGPAWLCWPS